MSQDFPAPNAHAPHLYLHVPFCNRLCPYCAFVKQPAAQGGFEEFVEALLKEAEIRALGLQPETVFFGGGTPTALSTRQLEKLLGGLHSLLSFVAVRECTMEMNPATIPLNKLERLLALGVNRASLGVQSWNARHLRTLGRSHSPAAARQSFEHLRAAGFANINVDLMFGIPGQSLEDWRADLETTVELTPDHISCYSLTYEEDTEFFERLGRGELRSDPELDAEQFELAQEFLEDAGFPAYETSNFSRPGRQCLHNLAIWQGADYLGLGPGAVSTLGSWRLHNESDLREYLRKIGARLPPIAHQELINASQRRLELLALGLRTAEGVPAGDLRADTLHRLIALGLGNLNEGRLRLTQRGRALADEVTLELMEPTPH